MIQIIAIGLFALGVVTFVGGALHKYNSALTKQAQTQAELDKCRTNSAELLGRVGGVNTALTALTNAQTQAQQISEAALKAAAKAEAGRAGERARAIALERDFKATGPCPADQAVEKVKEGLK